MHLYEEIFFNHKYIYISITLVKESAYSIAIAKRLKILQVTEGPSNLECKKRNM